MEEARAAATPESRVSHRARLGRALRSPAAAGLVAVALAGWGLVETIDGLGGPEAIRARWGMWAAAVAVPTQVIVSVSPLPGEIVALANSAVYGFWLGMLFSWLGWMGAAFAEYALFQRLASDAAGDLAGRARLPGWLARLPVDHPAYLVCVRFLQFGSHIVNATAGAGQVSLARFTWTSALALIPGSAGISALANGLVSLS